MEELEPQPLEAKANKEVVKRFRATSDEVKRINGKAAKAGLNFSEYCRKSALDKEVVEVIPPDLRRQISAAGNNLNQLTRLANAGKLSGVSTDRLNELLTLLLQTLK
ncbi:plasmid mobilization protein [Hymenobacter sp. GOD-10R]|uniref:plasmid mobilization protein n=1 Tax=Hymenobacter sp. GOD-10R TaxID=3093922 RepID=UPI002D7865EE|nr:plasmid mobilization relaxosome protein MobC [Hymenobacter sp. GOD-10R]WRQ31620.1 plasmid mobilization relaxosome protein MobC [Hymenobacter sp. GOD-10R]